MEQACAKRDRSMSGGGGMVSRVACMMGRRREMDAQWGRKGRKQESTVFRGGTLRGEGRGVVAYAAARECWDHIDR
jgi:hypothetical protein